MTGAVPVAEASAENHRWRQNYSRPRRLRAVVTAARVGGGGSSVANLLRSEQTVAQGGFATARRPDAPKGAPS